MKHKLMEAMRLREHSRELSGRVELDDGYLGGVRSGGKTGRGSENRVPFVTAVQTTGSDEAQLVGMAQLPFTSDANTEFINKRLVRLLAVVSDGLACFTVAADAGAHEVGCQSGPWKSRRRVRFNCLEFPRWVGQTRLGVHLGRLLATHFRHSSP